MGYFLIFIIIAIAIAAIVNENRKQKHLMELWQRYNQLLRGSDKRAALQAGRAYYSALRKGLTLTIYDEQAIANDLATMN